MSSGSTRFNRSRRLRRLSRLRRSSRSSRFLALLLFFILGNQLAAQRKVSFTGTLKISFVNTVNGQPLVLYDSTYHNPFSETFNITKLRYYISNLRLTGRSSQKEKNSYHLVDASKPESLEFSFSVKPGSFKSLEFLFGVDSSRNCSGAQTGALDPMNDMFWTWNNGYVMFKMEGSSAASTLFNNRIEYHIGGYAGINNVIKTISIPSAYKILSGKTTKIIIETNLDKLWQGETDLKITETAMCTSPGPLAKKIANNYSDLFSIKTIFTN